MSKHKTRQQKIIAQLRRELHSKSQGMVSLPTPSKPVILPPIKTVQQEPSYRTQNGARPYLLSDLSKTFILTSCIVVLELLLFFLSQKHIIQLPI